MTTQADAHTHGLAPFRQPNFTLAWTAGLISMAGDWALKIALPILVLQLTGSIAATSGVVIAGMLPALLFGAFAGVFVDRWDRRRVMIAANVLQAAALLPLLAVHQAADIWIVYAVMAVAATINQFFKPAEAALVPMLVDMNDLVAANALNGVNNNLARLLGPAGGGLIVAAGGLPGIVAVDAVTFVVSAALLCLIRGGYRTARPAATSVARHPFANLWREFGAGLRVIRGSRVLIVLVATFAFTQIGEGIMEALFAVYVRDSLHGGAQEVGWLMSAQAVGGVLGGVVGSALSTRFSTIQLLVAGSVGLGSIDLVLFTYPLLFPVLWPAVVLFILAGVPAVLLGAAAMAEIQKEATDAYCGRVFAVNGTLMGLTATIGATLAGTFGDRLGAITMLIAQGLVYVLAGIVIGLLLRRKPQGVSVPASSRDTSAVSPSATSPASSAD
jgi:predicted MFS family arabinose efflux permease